MTAGRNEQACMRQFTLKEEDERASGRDGYMDEGWDECG